MRAASRPAPAGSTGRRDTVLLALFAALLVLVALGGGASRDDVQSLIYVRPAAILFIGACAAACGKEAIAGLQRPILFAASLFAVVALQLVPLPPSLWSALPGRDLILPSAALAGIEQPWRPISLTPGATLNSLVALVVPLAALIGAGVMARRWPTFPIWLVLGLTLFSGLLGMMQFALGADSSLYLYRITNEGSGVGLFSNRNHQAIFLCLGFPAVFWAYAHHRQRRTMPARAVLAAFSLYLLASVWATGSRAGLVISIAALVVSAVAFCSPRTWTARSIAGAVAAAAAVPLLALLIQAQSFERLMSKGASDELRLLLFDDFVRMAQTFFPFGSGFGSFATVYRHFERAETLGPNYVNQAHMDWLQIVIEGGLPALLLLLVFLLWWAAAALRAFSASADARPGARVAVIGTAALMIGSIADYPLRTPLLASIFTILCVMMLAPRKAETASAGPERTADSAPGNGH